MEIRYCPVNNVERIFSETKEHNIDSELVLPDYCPSIVKILACSIECFNENVSVSGDKLNTDAYASIRLLYVGDENKISVFRQEIGFAKSAVCADVSENDVLTVTHKNISVSTRVTGQRRIEVHAVTAVCFELNRYVTHNFVSGADDGALECRAISTSYFDNSAFFSDTFDAREECDSEFPTEKNPDIIRKNAVAICNEYKTVKNKLMVKGICETQLAYTTDGENVSIYRKNIPFTNVFDISGIREGDECFIALFCENVRIVKSDRNGTAGSEVCVKIRIEARSGKSTDVSIVTDAYSPVDETVIKQLEESVIKKIRPCDKTIATEVIADSYEDKFTAVADCWTEKLSYDYTNENGVIRIRGSVALMALVLTEKKEYLCIMRNASFEDELECAGEQNRALVASLSKNTMSAVIQNDGKIKFKTDFRLLGYMVENDTVSGVSSVECSDGESGAQDGESVITVYFADEGENLWSIAKKNRTTVSLIKKYNENTEDDIKEHTVLILPSCE